MYETVKKNWIKWPNEWLEFNAKPDTVELTSELWFVGKTRKLPGPRVTRAGRVAVVKLSARRAASDCSYSAWRMWTPVNPVHSEQASRWFARCFRRSAELPYNQMVGGIAESAGAVLVCARPWDQCRSYTWGDSDVILFTMANARHVGGVLSWQRDVVNLGMLATVVCGITHRSKYQTSCIFTLSLVPFSTPPTWRRVMTMASLTSLRLVYSDSDRMPDPEKKWEFD